jgi:hypothetical protein
MAKTDAVENHLDRRKERLAELLEYAKQMMKLDPRALDKSIIRGIADRAQRDYGVSRVTALDYANAVLLLVRD